MSAEKQQLIATSEEEEEPPAYVTGRTVMFADVHTKLTTLCLPADVRDATVFDLCNLLGVSTHRWDQSFYWWSRKSRRSFYTAACWDRIAKTPYMFARDFYFAVSDNKDNAYLLSPVTGTCRADTIARGVKALATVPLAQLYQQ